MSDSKISEQHEERMMPASHITLEVAVGQFAIVIEQYFLELEDVNYFVEIQVEKQVGYLSYSQWSWRKID